MLETKIQDHFITESLFADKEKLISHYAILKNKYNKMLAK